LTEKKPLTLIQFGAPHINYPGCCRTTLTQHTDIKTAALVFLFPTHRVPYKSLCISDALRTTVARSMDMQAELSVPIFPTFIMSRCEEL
jgi:hypothetical protein